jgi:hypothetical protein
MPSKRSGTFAVVREAVIWRIVCIPRENCKPFISQPTEDLRQARRAPRTQSVMRSRDLLPARGDAALHTESAPCSPDDENQTRR